EFSKSWISQIPRLLKETGSFYVISGWTHLEDILVAAKQQDLHLLNHIIWKYQFGVFTRKKFVTSHYHILLFVKNLKKYYFNKIEHYPLDVWEIPRKYLKGEQKNPTKLPENLINRCIDFSSKPGDLVLDPFIGNGTTAVCAKKRYRYFIGFEVNTNLKPILTKTLEGIQLGEGYIPHSHNIPNMKELAKKYPAVRKYLRESNQSP
ncbi:MAG: DNA-methyltransferase, partial [Candidatus Ranarchaeia archaeon]